LKEEENCFLEKAFEGRKKMEHIEDMVQLYLLLTHESEVFFFNQFHMQVVYNCN